LKLNQNISPLSVKKNISDGVGSRNESIDTPLYPPLFWLDNIFKVFIAPLETDSKFIRSAVASFCINKKPQLLTMPTAVRDGAVTLKGFYMMGDRPIFPQKPPRPSL
jgi:hypothetical protein